MKFREIETSDLPVLADLLSEGFPSTTRKFWTRALGLLQQRQPVEGLPCYGIALEAGGTLNGVLLMLNQRRGETTFCNLSSWYVREEHRGAAPFMFSHALAAKGVTYLDCSPTPEVVPVIERFGFAPFTGGALMLDARMSLRRGQRVTALTPEAVTSGPLAETGVPQADRIVENLRYGCQGLIARDAEGRPVPVLYRVARVKRHIPIARFVYGAPETIAAHAGSIAAYLLARGIPVAHVDWPVGTEPPVGRLLPRYGVRYRRGAGALPVGDLLDTEYAVFGI
jgi:hypothetical protein